MSETALDHAPVRVFAPIVFAASFAVGALLSVVLPPPALRGIERWPLGIVLVALGLAFGLPAMRAMRRAGTSPNPHVASAALVEDGTFRFSRNPMYVSMVLIFAGLAVMLRETWSLVLLIPAVFIVQRMVIEPEERYLEGKFGEAYASYKARVRRWL